MSDYANSVALQRDGKIVAAGETHVSSTDDNFALARYRGDTCVVPKLKGRPLAGAKALIKRKRCKVGKIKSRHSKKVTRGRVIAQKPVARTKVAAETKIRLIVSTGPRP